MSANPEPQGHASALSWPERGALLFAISASVTVTSLTYLVFFSHMLSDGGRLPLFAMSLVHFAFGFGALLMALSYGLRKRMNRWQRGFVLALGVGAMWTIPLGQLVA